jgi:hypothetical protein
MTGERGELIWKREEVAQEIRRRIRKMETEGTRIKHGDGSTTRIRIEEQDGWREVRCKIQSTTTKDIEHRARGDLREIGPEEELEIMDRLEGGAGRRKGGGKASRKDSSSEREPQPESGTEENESEEDQRREEERRKRRRGGREGSHRTGAEAMADRENKKRTRETRGTTHRNRKKKKGESAAISSDYQQTTNRGQTYNTGSKLTYGIDEEETERLLRKYRSIIEEEEEGEEDQLEIYTKPNNWKVETRAATRRSAAKHFVIRSTGTLCGVNISQ